MTDYTITTNFGAKDSLPSGNAAKVVKGSEFTTEFTNIATAVNSKADTAGDTFTGVVNFSADVAFDTDTLFVDVSTNRVGIGTSSPDALLHVDGGDLKISSDSDTSDGDGMPAILFSEEPASSTGVNDANGGIVYNGDGANAGNNYIGIGCFENGLETEDTLAEQKLATTFHVLRDGRVGIGTSTPTQALDVVGNINIQGTVPTLVFTDTDNNPDFHIVGGGSLSFRDVTNNTTRMLIDSDGDVLIGTTDNTLYNNNASGSNSTGTMITPSGEIQVARYQNTPLRVNRMGNDGTCISIHNRGVTVGSISTTSTATTYITSSDERLKENITDSADAGSKVDAIQIRQFDWKADGSHQDYGVIAQELIEVAPEAVAEGDTEEDMMGVDYSKLVPLLVKEVQALRSRVAQLEESV